MLARARVWDIGRCLGERLFWSPKYHFSSSFSNFLSSDMFLISLCIYLNNYFDTIKSRHSLMSIAYFMTFCPLAPANCCTLHHLEKFPWNTTCINHRKYQISHLRYPRSGTRQDKKCPGMESYDGWKANACKIWTPYILKIPSNIKRVQICSILNFVAQKGYENFFFYP